MPNPKLTNLQQYFKTVDWDPEFSDHEDDFISKALEKIHTEERAIDFDILMPEDIFSDMEEEDQQEEDSQEPTQEAPES